MRLLAAVLAAVAAVSATPASVYPKTMTIDSKTHPGHTAFNPFDKGIDFNTLPWEPFKPGVTMVPLYGDFSNGASAKLLRYEPGAKVALHKHLGWEHIFILKGSQLDVSGEHKAGDILFNHPGSCHRLESKEGCVLLAIYEKPVSFSITAQDCPETDRV